MNTGLGKTALGETVPFSITDRRTHALVVGKTGQGKSVALENIMMDDLAAGRGFAFFDPHGNSTEKIADCIPPERIPDVIYFDPTSPDCPSFNPLDGDNPALIAEQVTGDFRDKWPESWGPRLEYILLNTIRLLLTRRYSKLTDLKRVLVDYDFREGLLRATTEQDLLAIWRLEFGAKTEKQWNEEIASTLNKVGRLTSVDCLRRILGRPPTIDFRRIMDEGKILIVSLPVGEIGEAPASLIGSLLFSSLANAASSRSRTNHEHKLRDFTVYMDECRYFITQRIDTTLSESRKWRFPIVLAAQYLSQLPESLGDAILGNVGTIVTFKTSAKTAKMLADDLDVPFGVITDLSPYTAYAKLPRHRSRFIWATPPMAERTGSFKLVKANMKVRLRRRN